MGCPSLQKPQPFYLDYDTSTGPAHGEIYLSKMIVIQNVNLFGINILNSLKLAAGMSRKKGGIKLEIHFLSLTFVVEYLFIIMMLMSAGPLQRIPSCEKQQVPCSNIIMFSY